MEDQKRKRFRPTVDEDSTSPSGNDGTSAAPAPQEDGFTQVTRKRVKPLFVHDEDYFGIAKCLEAAGVGFDATKRGKQLKFCFDSANSYRLAVHLLDERKIEFHSFLLREEQDLKFVVRGLPIKSNPDDISEAIVALGFQPKHVAQVKSFGRPQPLFLVYLDPSPAANKNNKEFKAVTKIGRLCVSVEKFRGRPGPVQCFRCQRFGHHSAACHAKHRCVACAGDHDAKACPSKGKQEPKCCNCCKVGHPANYRGCTIAKRLSKRKVSQPEPRAASKATNAGSSLRTVAPVKPAQLVRADVSFAQMATGKSAPTPLPVAKGQRERVLTNVPSEEMEVDAGSAVNDKPLAEPATASTALPALDEASTAMQTTTAAVEVATTPSLSPVTAVSAHSAPGSELSSLGAGPAVALTKANKKPRRRRARKATTEAARKSVQEVVMRCEKATTKKPSRKAKASTSSQPTGEDCAPAGTGKSIVSKTKSTPSGVGSVSRSDAASGTSKRPRAGARTAPKTAKSSPEAEAVSRGCSAVKHGSTAKPSKGVAPKTKSAPSGTEMVSRKTPDARTGYDQTAGGDIIAHLRGDRSDKIRSWAVRYSGQMAVATDPITRLCVYMEAIAQCPINLNYV